MKISLIITNEGHSSARHCVSQSLKQYLDVANFVWEIQVDGEYKLMNNGTFSTKCIQFDEKDCEAYSNYHYKEASNNNIDFHDSPKHSRVLSPVSNKTVLSENTQSKQNFLVSESKIGVTYSSRKSSFISENSARQIQNLESKITKYHNKIPLKKRVVFKIHDNYNKSMGLPNCILSKLFDVNQDKITDFIHSVSPCYLKHAYIHIYWVCCDSLETFVNKVRPKILKWKSYLMKYGIEDWAIIYLKNFKYIDLDNTKISNSSDVFKKLSDEFDISGISYKRVFQLSGQSVNHDHYSNNWHTFDNILIPLIFDSYRYMLITTRMFIYNKWNTIEDKFSSLYKMCQSEDNSRSSTVDSPYLVYELLNKCGLLVCLFESSLLFQEAMDILLQNCGKLRSHIHRMITSSCVLDSRSFQGFEYDKSLWEKSSQTYDTFSAEKLILEKRLSNIFENVECPVFDNKEIRLFKKSIIHINYSSLGSGKLDFKRNSQTSNIPESSINKQFLRPETCKYDVHETSLFSMESNDGVFLPSNIELITDTCLSVFDINKNGLLGNVTKIDNEFLTSLLFYVKKSFDFTNVLKLKESSDFIQCFLSFNMIGLNLFSNIKDTDFGIYYFIESLNTCQLITAWILKNNSNIEFENKINCLFMAMCHIKLLSKITKIIDQFKLYSLNEIETDISFSDDLNYSLSYLLVVIDEFIFQIGMNISSYKYKSYLKPKCDFLLSQIEKILFTCQNLKKQSLVLDCKTDNSVSNVDVLKSYNHDNLNSKQEKYYLMHMDNSKNVTSSNIQNNSDINMILSDANNSDINTMSTEVFNDCKTNDVKDFFVGEFKNSSSNLCISIEDSKIVVSNFERNYDWHLEFYYNFVKLSCSKFNIVKHFSSSYFKLIRFSKADDKSMMYHSNSDKNAKLGIYNLSHVKSKSLLKEEYFNTTNKSYLSADLAYSFIIQAHNIWTNIGYGRHVERSERLLLKRLMNEEIDVVKNQDHNDTNYDVALKLATDLIQSYSFNGWKFLYCDIVLYRIRIILMKLALDLKLRNCDIGNHFYSNNSFDISKIVDSLVHVLSSIKSNFNIWLLKILYHDIMRILFYGINYISKNSYYSLLYFYEKFKNTLLSFFITENSTTENMTNRNFMPDLNNVEHEFLSCYILQSSINIIGFTFNFEKCLSTDSEVPIMKTIELMRNGHLKITMVCKNNFKVALQVDSIIVIYHTRSKIESNIISEKNEIMIFKTQTSCILNPGTNLVDMISIYKTKNDKFVFSGVIYQFGDLFVCSLDYNKIVSSEIRFKQNITLEVFPNNCYLSSGPQFLNVKFDKCSHINGIDLSLFDTNGCLKFIDKKEKFMEKLSDSSFLIKNSDDNKSAIKIFCFSVSEFEANKKVYKFSNHQSSTVLNLMLEGYKNKELQFALSLPINFENLLKSDLKIYKTVSFNKYIIHLTCKNSSQNCNIILNCFDLMCLDNDGMAFENLELTELGEPVGNKLMIICQSTFGLLWELTSNEYVKFEAMKFVFSYKYSMENSEKYLAFEHTFSVFDIN